MKLYLSQGDWLLYSEERRQKSLGEEFATGLPVEIPIPIVDRFRNIMAALEAVQEEIEPYYEAEMEKRTAEWVERERNFVGPPAPLHYGNQLLASQVCDVIEADENGNAIVKPNPRW